MGNPRIAIIGAGIGGLTLALALQSRGVSCTIYEQADELREVGAAVGLSAASTRFYIEALGMEASLSQHWFALEALTYRDAFDGNQVAEYRFDYRDRYGAPFVGIHRAEFQRILAEGIGSAIQLEKRLTDIDDTGTEAVLSFADGSTAAADLVIGADGAKSLVRRLLLGYDDALYSGTSGFRGIVPRSQMPSMPDPGALQFWMGPGAHCLHYPMNDNGDHNFLLVERGPAPWPHKAWLAPATEQEKLDRFGSWHPAVVEMISAVPTPERWALFHRPPLSKWSKGRITLLGDAAHAMVPHHGQGANTSIEDAIVLADQLTSTNDLETARSEYERLRRGRTRKIQFASITTADILHLPNGERATERNERLARPSAWDHHLDWVHGFRPSEQAPSEVQGGAWL